MKRTTKEGGETPSLKDLEKKLERVSHNDEALTILKDFAKEFTRTRDRQITLGQANGLLLPPIYFEESVARGAVSADEDQFQLLQGDLVRTDAAYFMGSRTENGLFVVASSTCDLIQGRRSYASLLRTTTLTKESPGAAQILGEVLSFKSKHRMFLPPLPRDREEESGILAYIVEFDGHATIATEDLFLAERLASMTVVGWRILGALVRNFLVREAAGETIIRTRAADET